MAITEHTSPIDGGRRYVRPPRPIHFPGSEEMPETNRHIELRTALYQLLKAELASRATLGSSQFVYYDPTTASKRLAPDAFVKLDVPHTTFRVWKTWLHGAPDIAVEVADDLAVEVASDSDIPEEAWETKLQRYLAAGIGEVVRFDPDDEGRPLRVWDHIEGDLVERERPEDGVFECARLGLFWVVTPHPAFVRMLRLARDREGRDLLPTPEERAQIEARARKEEERARKEEERARKEAEWARDEEARRRVEAERARDGLAAELAALRKKLAARAPRRSATAKKKAPASKKR